MTETELAVYLSRIELRMAEDARRKTGKSSHSDRVRLNDRRRQAANAKPKQRTLFDA